MLSRLFRSTAQLRFVGPRQSFVFRFEATKRVQQTSTMSTSSDTSIPTSKYPQARRDEKIVDDFHGTKLSDPYRWMEDPDNEETKAFVDELNKISKPFIEQSVVREKLKEKLTKMWDYEKYGSQTKHGDFYYIYYNSGIQNQSVLYQSKTYKEKGKVFFDVNKLAEDGTTAISSSSWSEDGKYLAIGLSEKGSDSMKFKFMKNNGEELKDEILDIKFSGLDWLPKNDAVIYAKYPTYKTDAKDALVADHKNHSVYLHKMGTDCKDDLLIAEFPDHPKDLVSVYITEDHSMVVVSSSGSCGDTNRLYYHDLKATNYELNGKLDLKPLFTDNEYRYDLVCPIGDGEALILTNKDAPMAKLIRIKLNVAEKDPSTWKTIVPEDTKRRLEYVIPFAHDKMLLIYGQDAHTVIEIRELETGKFVENLPLPLCTAYSLHTRQNRTELFFSYESFVDPPTSVRVDYAQKRAKDEPLELEVVHQSKIEGFDASKYETKQIFYDSKDGTKVPLFIVAAKDVKLDSNNPTMLYGYGGFDITLTPTFSISRCVFLQNFNGIYAQANIRGGGEYGRNWHHNGRLEKKQNVFDDFQAAGKWLIDNKYTRPERLSIRGGSNGGLLVAACAQQAPHLFGAAIAQVGVLDMYRYHKFTIGSAWMSEYGDAEKPEHFEFLRKYSPLHNVRMQNGQQWPAMLLMTADHDDRVTPSHTLKYIAELYHVVHKDGAEIQKRPIMARIEVNAGHGAGKPTSKSIEEMADVYAFLERVLQLEWKD
ncbi:Prolyl endopeptidase [Aphelenchoides besseyi]|nr:Prolyl endopeptidase [Aphelenchoides besseyi]